MARKERSFRCFTEISAESQNRKWRFWSIGEVYLKGKTFISQNFVTMEFLFSSF